MPIDDRDWPRIYEAIENAVAGIRAEVTAGEVIDVDEAKRIVYIAGTGNQPIPIFAFEYEVKYYDTNSGIVNVKHATARPKMPKIGEIVLVLRQYGDRRMPRCIGVLQSVDFTEPPDADSEVGGGD